MGNELKDNENLEFFLGGGMELSGHIRHGRTRPDRTRDGLLTYEEA